jgi:hypothetical protein
MRNRLQALGIALAVSALVLAWQVLTVRYSYGGNWSGLFCTGSRLPYPPELAHENIYVFPDSSGYDGQAYHYMAHDPWFRRGFSNYIDAPRLRTRRILVPALAWLAALGNDSRIDAALIGVVVAFVGLGSFWSARLAQHPGKPAWLGGLFLLAPAVLVSIDRILTDGALAAFCIGFVLYFRREQWGRLWAVCALAALTRETGAGLIAAACIYLLIRRDVRRAALFAMAILPLVIWVRFAALHTPPDALDWLGPIPFEGIVYRLTHPSHYDFPTAVALCAIVVDYVALLGIALAICTAFRKALAQDLSMTAIAIYIFAVLAIFLRYPDAWSDVYAFGRTLSPLLVLLAMDALEAPSSGYVSALLPAALQVPRIGFQWGKQILNVVNGISGGLR